MSYIRGSAGLPAELARLTLMTAGQLQYIGEWHSHPDGVTCTPSEDDRTLFASLERALDADGVPPVMLIVGEDGQVTPFVETRTLRDARARWRSVGRSSDDEPVTSE